MGLVPAAVEACLRGGNDGKGREDSWLGGGKHGTWLQLVGKGVSDRADRNRELTRERWTTGREACNDHSNLRGTYDISFRIEYARRSLASVLKPTYTA